MTLNLDARKTTGSGDECFVAAGQQIQSYLPIPGMKKRQGWRLGRGLLYESCVDAVVGCMLLDGWVMRRRSDVVTDEISVGAHSRLKWLQKVKPPKAGVEYRISIWHPSMVATSTHMLGHHVCHGNFKYRPLKLTRVSRMTR